MRLWMFVASACLIASAQSVRAETIQQYAAECDAAMGGAQFSVPEFKCDDPAATEVPITHPHDANGVAVNMAGKTNAELYALIRSCDRPNRLNGECDPGSHFRVLTNTDVQIVAHCRKKGNAGTTWGDIAVIQHNKKNGATCFYQEGPSNGLLNDVKAPSDPNGNQWNSPGFTAGQGCGGCHDSGPFIRSPYLTQITGTNRIPGADDGCQTSECSTANNDPQPYSFVGPDFASWRAYEVKITGNLCNDCHRMGVSNVGGGGTSRDFGIRATQLALESSKNAHGPDSPLWMVAGTPNQVSHSPQHEAFAQAIKACADAFAVNPQSLPPNCTVKQYATAFVPAPPQPATLLDAALIDLLQIPAR